MSEQVEMEDNDDGLDEIFGNDTEYQAKVYRKQKEFSPWHRPRKQLVREEQWCAEISALTESINFDGRPLRYLGLPGNELFDLRTIHELICKPHDLRLKFLGFNNASGVEDDDGFELDLSTVEVKELDGVDKMSKVMPDDFKSLGTRNSMAWSNAKEFGHFDIINVDLCDGLFTATPATASDSYYNAIPELINLQARRGEPWLLFLTTRVGDKVIHADTLAKLKELINRNLSDSPKFAGSTKRHLDFDTITEVEQLMKEEKGLSDVFCVGISKWLITLGLSATPLWKVNLKSVWNYTVYPESTYPDLLSLAFEFTMVQVPVQDRVGLAAQSKNKSPKIPEEGLLAADVVPAVANAMDIDKYLRDNAQVKDRYIVKSEVLYEKARYPRDQYRQWLAKNNY
jgi:hypothetical protein